MLLDEENRRLGELVAPLGESIRLVWRGGGAPDARSVLDNQLMLTAQRFINLRDVTEEEKQRYYEEVCRLFRLQPAPETFPLRDSTDLPPHLLKRLDRTPVSVSYLETYDSRDETFGNARAARNLFEATLSKQANRLVSLPKVDREILSTIEPSDVPGHEELRPSGILDDE